MRNLKLEYAMTNERLARPGNELVNSFTAPDVFASDATGFVQFDGVAMITFESLRVDHSHPGAPASRVTIGRLVMPIGGAQRLALGLLDFLQKQGLDPLLALKGDSPVQ